MSSKTAIIKYVKGSEKFEIVVYADAAFEYRQNKLKDIDKVLVIDEVFTDSSKGQRASRDKLKKAFGTEDIREIEKEILTKGELPLTTEQRRKLIEDKKKQIMTIISKNYVDPKTNLPHPVIRIEKAMDMAGISIDPLKPAEEQAKLVVEKIRPYIALKTGSITLSFKIPAKYAYQVIKVLKEYGEIKQENWESDGSLSGLITIPLATQAAFLDRIASLTHGEGLVKLIE
ncbi:MAG: ribosome assembly factor SBDS [Nitrososphaeria archaeon]|jgi:ribosome maturation protein SDO1